VKADTFGYHPAVIPDDAAGRPLSPSELAMIADLEQRLLLETPEPVRARAWRSPRRRWYRSANAAPLTALVVVGIPLVVVAMLTGGLLGAGAVLLSVVVTAFAWPLLPRGVGGPLCPRRFIRFPRLIRRANPR
jgi:hypothetical protein